MSALPATNLSSSRLALPLVLFNDRRPNTTTIRALDWYDHILVSYSGGKDSTALVLELLRRGVPKDRIILMHQLVDGELGAEPFMDWPITAGYCRAFAEALGLRLLYQWRHGGFHRELMKDQARLAPVSFELLDGGRGTAGGLRGKVGTRRLFPQVTADLGKRWCSPALKIDVAAIAICNDPAFQDKRILFLTGERREESSARSRYAEMEVHRTHSRTRHVDHWRMVLDWSEEQVWSLLRRYRVVCHPAYRLGWGRTSCLACIFGQADQWASVRRIAPDLFARIARYEADFGRTIHKGKSIVELADRGHPYPECSDAGLVALALGRDYPTAGILTDTWSLPPGAFRHCGGPN
jgi:3'-phosphoadenosine 5'-phosphosulfate sulfotransferase (PAPS reductase)/FAD synthetase